ncbi:MAG: 1-phosphofructokinase [Thermoleophilaceae bacterium]|nr:1-phosphofructokinase [Thermoleophilaceae bacterium]
MASRYSGEAPDKCLRFAVACGAESVQHFGAGVIDPKEVGRLVDEVTVEPLAEPAMSSRG